MKQMNNKGQVALLGIMFLAVILALGAWTLFGPKGTTYQAIPLAGTGAGYVPPAGSNQPGFQPTINTNVPDALKPNTAVSAQVTGLLSGAKVTMTPGTAVNAAVGASYNLETVPTSTYFSQGPHSGTITADNPTPTVVLPMKLIATNLSTWATQLPSCNATQVNASTAPCAIGSGGNADPEICIKNNTQFSVFNYRKVGVNLDYNRFTYQTPTADGVGFVLNSNDTDVTATSTRPTGTTSSVGFNFNDEIGSSNQKCITLHLIAQPGVNPGTYANDGNVTVTFVDNYRYINTIDSSFGEGYQNNAGVDTNSATNQAVVFYAS